MNKNTEPKRVASKRVPKSKQIVTECPSIPTESNGVVEVKKRGRKPKGGKLITIDTSNQNEAVPPPNVILHLKCSLKDIGDSAFINSSKMKNPLDYDASVPPSIMTYDNVDPNLGFTNYTLDDTPKIIDKNAYSDNISSINVDNNSFKNTNFEQLCHKCNSNVESTDTNNDYIKKEINDKLKRLKLNLYCNKMNDKRSACFWCTYEFDNPECYIPRHDYEGEIFGYGSFCRPECAVGFLMNEHIDDSTKFERYHLLNRVYSKVYNYKNNIKPAPDPHYLLEKFYGNLSIQEYRKLLNSERMLFVVDNPLTRILPELHEDTDDFMVSVYGGNKGSATPAGGVYKVKRQSEKQPSVSKSVIIKEKFGITT
jgi:hypothetical protein